MKNIKQKCVVLLFLILYTISMLNIFQPSRKTISEKENRTLQTFPTLTTQSFFSGKFLNDLNNFVSDTFLQREKLLSVSEKINYYKSINAFVKNDEDFVYIAPKNSEENNDIVEEETTKTYNEELAHPDRIVVVDDFFETAKNKNEVKQTETKKVVETTKVEQANNKVVDASNENTLENANTKFVKNVTDNETLNVNAEASPVINNVKTKQVDISTTIAEVDSHMPKQDVIQYSESSETGESLKGGYIYYKNVAYPIGSFNEKKTDSFIKAVEEYSAVYPNAKVSVVVAPLSSMLIDNQRIQNTLMNQKEAIDRVYAKLPKNVNAVNVCENIFKHKDEHVYFKYDHHWTDRGAYYAYEEFAKSLGFTPTKISDMEERLITKNWHGSTYGYTNDERLKDASEEVYAYMPTHWNGMCYINRAGTIFNVEGCINLAGSGYTAFIYGDNPYSVITVPENPQDRTALVIKDSYGNAFAPYLCEHFGTIIVVDPRYVKFDLYTQLERYQITDIVFATNIYKFSEEGFLSKVRKIIQTGLK